MTVGGAGSLASGLSTMASMCFLRPGHDLQAVGSAAAPMSSAIACRRWSAVGRVVQLAARSWTLSRGNRGHPQKPAGGRGMDGELLTDVGRQFAGSRKPFRSRSGMIHT